MEEEASDLLVPLPVASLDPLRIEEILALPPSELNPSILEASLGPLPDPQAANAVIELLRKIDDQADAGVIIELGLARCAPEVGRLTSELGEQVSEGDIRRIISEDSTREEVLRAYTVLKEMKALLDTYSAIAPRRVVPAIVEEEDVDVARQPVVEEKEATGGGMDLDDPWGEQEATAGKDETAPALIDDPWETSSDTENDTPVETKPASPILQPEPSTPAVELAQATPPIGITIFLNQAIALSALDLASSGSLAALEVVCRRHRDEMYPYRLSVIEAIPGWVSPVDLESAGLLPSLGEDGRDKWLAVGSSSDGNASSPLSTAISAAYLPPSIRAVPASIPARPSPLASSELTDWYTSHILSLDAWGILDNQLAWIQHGASVGVTNLDQLGEDLSLLSRLVYDAGLSTQQHAQWTLKHWRTASQSEIIQAYLSHANSNNIVADIRRLVLPYLYVLESRAERAGQADPTLVDRLLHEAILGLPLDLALPVFEASKATLPTAQRIVKNDLDVARLALACLYGSEKKDIGVWSIMSSIFECLPVWELSGTDPASDAELTSTTLESIATFVRPTTASAPPPTSKDLFVFFHPLPFASLSRALDILDVHLESGEILARWNVGTQLRFLLQSARDVGDQKELAEKMVRRQRGLGEDGWRRLWDDMGRLAGGEEGGLLRGALGMLSVRERGRVYLGGVLGSGNFDTARKMIKRLQAADAVDENVVEQVVLETSKDFYLTAESGNIHTGDMKLAYDCLGVAPATPRISSERAYIEATSRLASFSSLALTPVEIRHTSDPLSLIRRVIESSDDAYKYPDIMLDLSSKLGAGSETAKGLVQAMIGRAAERQGDFERARKAAEGCVEVVRRHQRQIRIGGGHKRGQSSTSLVPPKAVSEEQEAAAEASLIDETWRLAAGLAGEAEYSNIPAKLALASHAIELAPADQIPGVLTTFRGLESSRIKLDQAAKRRRVEGISVPHVPSPFHEDVKFDFGPGEVSEDRVLGSRTAARAAKLALDIGGKFGGLRGLAHSPRLGGSPVLGNLPFQLPNRSASRSPNPAAGAGAGAGNALSRILSNSSNPDHGQKARPGSALSQRGEEGGTHTPRELFDGLGLGAGVGAAGEEAERVRQGARRALVRGVGWLLGAEEGEITGE
ncbi:hypothetical protein IAU60_001044 [Kwoniella sp. DSM 27419]